ncbi:MAG: hypothetical protein ACFFDD_10835 [Promethearchaeota archaeon]
MEFFEVEDKAVFVAAWISYLSTATGILKAIGKEVDLVDVGGYSGYAFHLNTSKGETCPSAPTVAPFNIFAEGLASFGWKIEQSWEGPDYGPSDDAKQIARAKDYFSTIKSVMKKTGRPIGIWGVPDVPEFGIVNGFADDKFIVSTFRSLPSMPLDDDPIQFQNLHAPGGLFKMVFKEPIEVKEESLRDQEAVMRAVRIAKGAERTEGYVSGPDSFDDWAHTLEAGIVPESEKESQEIKGVTQLNYHGNSYVAKCTQEGLGLSCIFLKRLTDRYKGKTIGNDLAKASENYKKAAALMEEYVELFPFSHERNWDPDEFSDEKRTKGAKILRETKPYVETAIAQMEKAIKNWE